MRTPIADFVREYADKKGSRFHMPGHKGQAFLGCEEIDITEIAGADALYEAEGIIAESEKNAAELFGTARTFFSTEGSSQCIRAMLHLVTGYWKSRQERKQLEKNAIEERETAGKVEKPEKVRPYIIAARNVHKAFLYAAALVDFDVVWMYPEEMQSLCSCKITVEQLEKELYRQKEQHDGMLPAAVYVTSPDYLGGRLDIGALAKICHDNNTILAVDNAHGAYLHFLEEECHPMDLGADICCDSAHKTLPVLTGGAYLHINKTAPAYFAENAKWAMVLFGSTSPSYLTMASLDLCNKYLANGYKERLTEAVQRLQAVREVLREAEWEVEETDPLKLTIQSGKGLSGIELAQKLREKQIECEYADEDYIVFMITPENKEKDFKLLIKSLREIREADLDRKSKKRTEFGQTGLIEEGVAGVRSQKLQVQLRPVCCEQRISIRKAIFAEQEMVGVEDALERICGTPTVGCPPAIPIVVPGEEINEEAVRLFGYYGVEKVAVVKEYRRRLLRIKY